MPLPQGQYLSQSAKADLAGRAQDLKNGGLPELLRKAGKEMYDNPVVNTAISLTPGAGDLQSGFEAFKSAREGDWTGAGLNAVGILPFVPALRTVWHGSPHKFDAFDMGKIGTGEGAQAYGHGLYFADLADDAKKYQPRDPKLEETLMKHYSSAEKSQNYPAMQVYEDFLTHKSPDEIYLDTIYAGGFEGKDLEAAKHALEVGKKEYKAQTAGALYKVDLPDEHIANMVDFDAPLSEQKNIQDAFISHITESQRLSPDRAAEFLNGKTGGEAYFAVGGKNPDFISGVLREKGVPGIKFKTADTRTNNYVVFDDQIPQILERNGNPLAEALRKSK